MTNASFVHRLHRFHSDIGQPRIQRHPSAHGHHPFRPLPAPTSGPPYHLDLATVLPTDDLKGETLVFHTSGDTGGMKTPVPQMNVAHQMVEDCRNPHSPKVSFFYHLGDIVYFYGESKEYYPQFYEPYAQYPAPIFAIPGNHDGDLSKEMETSGVRSLGTFVENFCQTIPHHTPEALDERRTAMTQPNVYWTLNTRLVTIIGLYTNVPDGGRLDDDQLVWLQEELENAPKDRALIVAMHHPIYSLDTHHSGSPYMHRILDDAILKANRRPDAVLAGHVHNYQRFTRHQTMNSTETRRPGDNSNDRWEVPYIVAGGGGYHNLHRLPSVVKDQLRKKPYTDESAPDVVLNAACDDQFGFLRVEITATSLKGNYIGVSGFQDPEKGQGKTVDAFEIDLKAHKVYDRFSPKPESTERGVAHVRGA